jgi:pimeloyl-ACP methyl ester carboxylesterase
MRMIVAVLVALIVGAAGAVALLLVLRQRAIAPIADQVDYHFQTCVFGTADFPGGDFDNGRLLRRSLVTVDVSTRFFDAGFHEVARADDPGRYGAVVRIKFAGVAPTYRFITLYRTPAPVRGDFVRIPINAQISAEFGLDPTVLAKQQPEIGGALQDMLVDYEESSSPESFAILLGGLSEMGASQESAHLHDGVTVRNDAWWYRLKTQLGLAQDYRYLVDLPQGYDDDRSKRWPVILFLHGADSGGRDLNSVRNSALPALIAQGKHLPAIVISPQCPEFQSWDLPALAHLLDTLQTKYRVDADRVYLTGVSAGGDLTWDLALVHPEKFAAIVPMSGESDPGDAAQLRSVPVWGFNGEKDETVPPALMTSMVEAVRQAGGAAHLTIIPGAGHDCWTQSYSTDALWRWLFAQKRGQPEVRVPGTPSP